MAVSTRLKGNEGFYLTFEDVGAVSPFVAGDDVKSYEVTSEDKDDSDLTFREAQDGATKEYTLSVTAIVSFDTTSFWSYLWENAGEDVEVVIGPKGNEAPTATKPHFVGTGKLNGKPTFANEARTSQEGAEFTFEFVFEGELEKVTA